MTNELVKGFVIPIQTMPDYKVTFLLDSNRLTSLLKVALSKNKIQQKIAVKQVYNFQYNQINGVDKDELDNLITKPVYVRNDKGDRVEIKGWDIAKWKEEISKLKDTHNLDVVDSFYHIQTLPSYIGRYMGNIDEDIRLTEKYKKAGLKRLYEKRITHNMTALLSHYKGWKLPTKYLEVVCVEQPAKNRGTDYPKIEFVNISSKLSSFLSNYVNIHTELKGTTTREIFIQYIYFFEWLFANVDFNDTRTYDQQEDDYIKHLLKNTDGYAKDLQKKKVR